MPHHVKKVESKNYTSIEVVQKPQHFLIQEQKVESKLSLFSCTTVLCMNWICFSSMKNCFKWMTN